MNSESSNDLIGLGIVTVMVNISLMLVKIIAGIVGNSYALIADGIESASDIISSLITWTGFHLSLRPADKEHPYGHGKIESLAGIFSGGSLIAAAILIAYNSVKEIANPHGGPEWFTLPILLIVIVIKELLSRKVLQTSNEVGSNALKGDGWHHRSDAITSAATAIGVSIALFGGHDYEAADDWAALIACIIIFINGILVINGSFHAVIDGTVDEDTIASVSRTAESIKAVANIHKVRIRRSGIWLFADMHVRVSPTMTVFDGHAVTHEIKEKIMLADKRIKDVVIHLEPARGNELLTQ